MEMRLSHYSIVTLDNLSDIPYGSSLNDDIIQYIISGPKIVCS